MCSTQLRPSLAACLHLSIHDALHIETYVSTAATTSVGLFPSARNEVRFGGSGDVSCAERENGKASPKRPTFLANARAPHTTTI